MPTRPDSYPPERIDHALVVLRAVQEDVESLRSEVRVALASRTATDADQTQRLTLLDTRATQLEARLEAAKAEAQQAITDRVELELGRLRAARTGTLTGSGLLLATLVAAILARLLGIDVPGVPG